MVSQVFFLGHDLLLGAREAMIPLIGFEGPGLVNQRFARHELMARE